MKTQPGVFDSDNGWRRRDVLVSMTSAIVGGLALCLPPWTAKADEYGVDRAMNDVIGNRAVVTDGIRLEIPDVAENGQMVQTTVVVDRPMKTDEYVARVHLFADGNPQPRVATLHYGPNTGAAWTTVRIRLARTQNVIAIAEMNDGSILRTQKNVQVTVGGCG